MMVDSDSLTAFISTRAGEIHVVDLSNSPPLTKHVVKLNKKNHIRDFDLNFDEGRMFVGDFDSGTLYQYNVTTPISPDGPVELVNTFNGAKYPRVLKYWRERDELYVGHSAGKLTIYELVNFTSGAICKEIF